MTAQEHTETYRAEDAFLEVLRTAENHGGEATFNEVTYRPEGFVRFARIEDVAAYVAKVLARIGRDPDEIYVEHSQGWTTAHYYRPSKRILLPKKGAWSMNSVVVGHEMAHHTAGQSGHDQRFRLAFVRLLEGIGQIENARLLQDCYLAHGLPVLSAETTGTTIARIGKVLRQAESASTEDERSTFLAKAQEMATRHSVTLATARAHQARTEQRATPTAKTYWLGEPRQRGLRQLVLLVMGIGSANDVKFTIFGNNTGVTMYGFAEDIDLTIALYESVYAQMVADCEDYLATGGWKGEKVWSDKQWNWVPITKITARLAFYDAYQFRVARRLQAAKIAAEQVLETEEAGTALVLRDKQVEVRDAFSAATKHIKRSWSPGTQTGSERARAAGDKAGRSASLGTEKALS